MTEKHNRLPPPYGGEDGHRQNIPEHPAFPEHDRAGKRCGRLPHPHKHQYAGCRFGQRTPEKHRKEIYEKGAALLERLELGQYKDTLAKNLPYGIQRKVEIARALAISPKILLLDEPAAGMNPNETHELLLFVKKLNAEGLTVVVIEHDLKFIMNVCDHIMVLNYGQKLCEGNAQEIQNNKQVQEAYFGKRAGLGGTEG